MEREKENLLIRAHWALVVSELGNLEPSWSETSLLLQRLGDSVLGFAEFRDLKLAMAQVAASSASFTALGELRNADIFLKQRRAIPNVGAPRRHRYPSIAVSRVSETTTSTTTSTDRNGSVTSQAAIAKPKAMATSTGFTSVGAVITIVRKQRLSRDEQMVNAVDVFSDFTGSKVFLQLVSVEIDAATGVGKRSQESFIKDWAEKATVQADKVQYTAEFRVGGEFGEPGAVLIRNTHQAEFYLESVALRLPSGTVYFPCHSYIAASVHDPKPRVFFSNKVRRLQPGYGDPIQ